MDEDANKIEMSEFIDSNSSLFVVLGVFSALSIYISDLSSDSLSSAPIEIRIGFVGALLLSLLLIILIYRQLVNHVGSIENLLQAHTKFRNWDLIIFTGGAIFLLPSLITPILQRLLTFYYLIALLGLLFSVPLIFRIASELNKRLAEEGITRYLQILALSAVTYRLTTDYSEYMFSNPHLYGAELFTLSNFLPVLYDISGVIALVLRAFSAVIGFVSIMRTVDGLGAYFREETD